MSKRLKEPFGKAGLIVAAIALVFALTGGALAATGNNPLASASKAKQGKQGKPGKTGAKGDTGPTGAAGKDGTNGTDGTNGAPGKDGTGASTETFNGAAHGCTEGGVIVKSASPEAIVCNGKKGKDGQTGFTDVLTPGKTEKGAFSVERGVGTKMNAMASFSIPLETGIAVGHAHFIASNGKEWIYNFDEEVEAIEEVAPSSECTGSAANPTAAAGSFCLYFAKMSIPAPTSLTGSNLITDPGQNLEVSPAGGTTGTTGAHLQVNLLVAGNQEGWGTWAVTAP